MDTRYYPETLDTMFVVNTPAVFRVVSGDQKTGLV